MPIKENWEILFPQTDAIKLDKKDKIILQHIHADSRVTLSALSKKVNLSKTNVARRIQELENKGVITGYHIFVDLFRLGFRLYQIKLDIDTTLEEKQQYIKRISKLPFVIQILVLQSKDGLLLRIAVKDNIQKAIDQLTKEINVSLFNINEISRMSIKPLDILEKTNSPIVMHSNPIQIKIDNTDNRILEGLAANSRIPLIDLSRKLKISNDIVNYRNKKLQNQLISMYFAAFNNFQLGYQVYLLTVEVFDRNLKDRIFNYLGSVKNTTGIIETISSKPITSFLFFKDVGELVSFEKTFLSKFPTIKKHHFTLIREQPTYRFLPGL